jgi:hypothetical protein
MSAIQFLTSALGYWIAAAFQTRKASMAERVGFEPTVHLCGRTHDFQSCTFGRSVTSPDFSSGQYMHGVKGRVCCTGPAPDSEPCTENDVNGGEGGI